jgi:hypothetical protein
MEYNPVIIRRLQLAMRVTNAEAEGRASPFISYHKEEGISQPIRFIQWIVSPGPADIPGMTEWLMLLTLCRYWYISNVELRWTPQNLQQDGRMWIACTSAIESQRFTKPDLIRKFPDAYEGQAGNPVDVQIPATSYQSWAKRGSDGMGLHKSPFEYDLEQYVKLSLSDEIAAFGINILFEDVEPLYKTPTTWTYGEFILTFDFHGFENLFAATSLEWIKAPLFFGNGGGGGGNNDIYGSTRAQSMLLCVSDTDIPVSGRSPMNKKSILTGIIFWRHRMRSQYSSEDLPRIGLNWSSVTSLLGVAANALSGVFTGILGDGPDPVEQHSTFLFLDGRDSSLLTPLDLRKIIRGKVTLNVENVTQPLAKFGGKIQCHDDWEVLQLGTTQILTTYGLIPIAIANGERLLPYYGVALSQFLQHPNPPDNGEIPQNTFALGFSPEVGAYAGPACRIAGAQGVPTLATLIRYRKLTGIGNPSTSLSFNSVVNAIGKAGTVIGSVARTVSSVVETIISDPSSTGKRKKRVSDERTIQTHSTALAPQGNISTQTVGERWTPIVDYYKINYPHYDAGHPEVYETFYFNEGLPGKDTALLNVVFTARVTFSGIWVEAAETEWDNNQPGSLEVPNEGWKMGKKCTPWPPSTQFQLIVPCLSKSLPVSLAIDIYVVHRRGSFQLTDDILNATPLSTAGLDSYTSETEIPIVSLVGGSNLKLIDGSQEYEVDAICPITTTVDIGFNKVFSYPERWIDDKGVEHVYEVGEQVAIAVVLVPRVIVQPGYRFNILSGATTTPNIQWRPSLTALFFDHPESIQFSGSEANAVLANPRLPGSMIWPLVTVERHVLIDGKVTGYDFNGSGGFTYSDISLSVCNILEADNTDQASIMTQKSIKSQGTSESKASTKFSRKETD